MGATGERLCVCASRSSPARPRLRCTPVSCSCVSACGARRGPGRNPARARAYSSLPVAAPAPAQAAARPRSGAERRGAWRGSSRRGGATGAVVRVYRIIATDRGNPYACTWGDADGARDSDGGAALGVCCVYGRRMYWWWTRTLWPAGSKAMQKHAAGRSTSTGQCSVVSSSGIRNHRARRAAQPRWAYGRRDGDGRLKIGTRSSTNKYTSYFPIN